MAHEGGHTPLDLGVVSKARTYSPIAVAVAALLVAGLAVPFLVGEQRSAQEVDLAARERDLTTPELPDPADPDASDIPIDGDRDGAPSAGADPSPGTSPAATSLGTTGSAGSLTPPTSGAPSTNTATDVGVTADTITFAFMIPDTAGASSLGFDIGLGDQADMIEHFANQVNEAGGVHGRKLRPVPILYDALDNNDHTAKCVVANEDHKVFAGLVVTAYHESAATCFTAGYKRIFAEFTGASTAIYPQSEGRLFTVGMGTNRIGANAAWELHRLGLLKAPDGRQLKVGIIHNEESTGAATFVQTLEAEGVDVEVALVGGNQAQVQSQIPVRVNQLRTAGVEVVMLTLNLINSTLFVQQAESQGWYPEYRVSDLGVMTARGAAERMPESFDGAYGVTGTRSGEQDVEPPQEAATRCLASYSEHAGREIDRNSTEASSVVATCGVFSIFAEGLRRAGPDLTTTTFSEGLRTLTAFEPPGGFLSSFGPSKFDATDANRIIQWHDDCTCYVAVTDPVKTRF